MEINQDEKDRIEAEEMIRLKAKKAFESRKSFREKAWEFANSAIVLWLLSTVLVAFAGYVYANYKEAAKLTSEIQNRRDVAVKALAHIRKEADTKDYYGPKWTCAKALNLLNGGDSELTSFQSTLHPEYKNKEFIPLLNDLAEASWLKRLTQTKRSKYNELETLMNESPGDFGKKEPSDDDRRIVKEVVDKAIQILSSM
jgi:hypothetical protein